MLPPARRPAADASPAAPPLGTAAATHSPAWQTFPVPQTVPSLAFPVATQTSVPVEHEVAPVRHGVAGVQPSPAVHDTQVPPLQTWPAPQPEPSESGDPVSAQVGVVPAHAIAPA